LFPAAGGLRLAGFTTGVFARCDRNNRVDNRINSLYYCKKLKEFDGCPAMCYKTCD
jgi:hypothetical protein